VSSRSRELRRLDRKRREDLQSAQTPMKKLNIVENAFDNIAVTFAGTKARKIPGDTADPASTLRLINSYKSIAVLTA
jgi:hypothetical protein